MYKEKLIAFQTILVRGRGYFICNGLEKLLKSEGRVYNIKWDRYMKQK